MDPGSDGVNPYTRGTTSFLPFNALTMRFTSRSSLPRLSLVALVDINDDSIDHRKTGAMAFTFGNAEPPLVYLMIY
jgi:hypothetical protein